jgi:MFS family permease
MGFSWSKKNPTVRHGSDDQVASSSASDTEKQTGQTAAVATAQDLPTDPIALEAHRRREKALLRKLDLHLVPGVAILYLLSFLDRSNVANAKLEGLTKDLGISDPDYSTGLTIFFIGYILFEVIWNIILKRIGPRIWLPLITLVWGIVATLQGVVQNNERVSGTAGFFVVRFFLGLTEGGLFPGKFARFRTSICRTVVDLRQVLCFISGESMFLPTIVLAHPMTLMTACGTNVQNDNTALLYSLVLPLWQARLVESSRMV